MKRFCLHIMALIALAGCGDRRTPAPETPVPYTGSSGYEQLAIEFLPPCAEVFREYRAGRYRQRGPLAEGQRCTARITVRSNGDPISGVPVYLAVRGCGWTDPFRRIDSAVTTEGVAELSFTAHNDRRFCSYLVTAGRERGSKSPRLRFDAYVQGAVR